MTSQDVALLSVLVAAIGWPATHVFTAWRERRNRQKQMVAAYLTEAYEHLALSANRPQKELQEFARRLEVAIAKIQLFGSPEQIELAHKFIAEWAEGEKQGRPRGSLDPLLFALRNALREELSLPEVQSKVHWIRPLGGSA